MAEPFDWPDPSSVASEQFERLTEEVIKREDHWQQEQVDEGPSAGRCTGGYMSMDNPLSLDTLPLDMSFLDWYPKGTATITYPNDLGNLESMTNLNPWIIEERSFLIAEAFESTNAGPRLHLEPLTPVSARPFVQFLYTGGYSLPSATGEPFQDVPTSLLVHCQLYRLADIYDLPELKATANLNIIRQCEFGCSCPNKPIDLCLAIEWVYKHMRQSTNVIDTITNYCVTCFLSHGLADDFEFRRVAYHLRPFHQELCRVSWNRGFENDRTAQAIIQMPFKPFALETYASREGDFGRGTRDDVLYHFHCEDAFESSSKERKMLEMSRAPKMSGLSLAFRSKSRITDTGGAEAKENHPFGYEQRSISEAPKQANVSDKFPKAANMSDNDVHRAVYDRRRVQSRERASLQEAELQELKQEHQAEAQDPVSVKQNNELNTDSEYEIVSGPAPVEDLSSESDTDADTLVVVDLPESSSCGALLPIRNRRRSSSITAVERRDSSDSGWELV